MLQIILTLDYEIHGNGDGCPQRLMVEPTYRLLSLCEQYGAKLSIMADVAEILKFKEYKDTYGHDRYYYDGIVEQLQFAVSKGHDVQLHIHSSYFNAKHDNRRWIQDWSEYNFAALPYERMEWMIRTSKEFLETILRPVNSDYQCIAFRAANWSVSPSGNVVRALVNNGIKIDTSVFKYGYRKGIVAFDYSRAYSQIAPWRVKEDDVCIRDDSSRLWEMPIYSEKRWIGAFLTYSRIYRAIISWCHKVHHKDGCSTSRDAEDALPYTRRIAWMPTVFKKHAWKADFNQCTSKQLINATHRASKRFDSNQDKVVLPFILIGHSKLFTKRNERDLRLFFKHLAKNKKSFCFESLTGISSIQYECEDIYGL